MDLSGIRVGVCMQVKGNDGHLVDDGIIDLGERVLHQQLVQTQVGAGNGEIALGGSHCVLIGHHLHRGNRIEFELLLIIGERLVGETERTLIDLLVLVGIDQVPINILDLGHGGNDLCFESKICDLSSCAWQCG